MLVKCNVAGEGEKGPELCPVWVDLTQVQYDLGDHREAAKDWAMDQGLEGEMVVFAESDPAPEAFFDLCDWTSVPMIGVPYGG